MFLTNASLNSLNSFFLIVFLLYLLELSLSPFKSVYSMEAIMKQQKVPRIPKEKVIGKKSMKMSFNLSERVYRLFVAHLCQMKCREKGFNEGDLYFNGLIRGYFDWFDALSISRDVIDSVMLKIDRKQALKEAGEIVDAMIKKVTPLVIMPSEKDVLKFSKGEFHV